MSCPHLCVIKLDFNFMVDTCLHMLDEQIELGTTTMTECRVRMQPTEGDTLRALEPGRFSV